MTERHSHGHKFTSIDLRPQVLTPGNDQLNRGLFFGIDAVQMRYF